MCFRLFILILFGVAQTSCGRFFESGQRVPDPPSVDGFLKRSGRGSSCLSSGFGGRLNRYLNSQMTPRELVEFWDCLGKVVLDIPKFIEEETYSKPAIRQFFNQYVLFDSRLNRPNYEITENFIHQIFVLKRSLFGGSAEFLTKEELGRFADFFEIMSRHAPALQPHWGYFLLDVRAEAQFIREPESMETALAALKPALNEIFTLLRPTLNDFSFSQLLPFLDELARFLKIREDVTWDQTLGRWLPLVEAVKVLSVSGQPGVISSQEWRLFPNEQVLRLYDLVIRLRFSFSKFSSQDLQSLDQLDLVVGSIEKYLNGLLDVRSFQSPQLKDILFLVERSFLIFSNSQLRPKFVDLISADTLVGTMSPILRHLFSFWDRGLPEDVRSLKLAHVRGLVSFVRSWIQMQRDLVQIREEDLLRVQSTTDLGEIISGDGGSPDYQLSRTLLLRSVHPSYGLKVNQGVREISYPTKSKSGFVNKEALLELNLSVHLVRLLFHAYSGQRSSAVMARSLTPAEFKYFERAIENLALEIRLFDPRSQNRGQRIIFEADLFSWFGNADGQLQFTEAVELLINNRSYGTFLFRKVYQDLMDRGAAVPGGFDVLGEPRLETGIVREHLQEAMTPVLDGLPFLKRFLLRLSEEERSSYFQGLLEMSTSALNCRESFESSTIQQMIVVMSYMELIMTRFDKDADNKLSEFEIEDSFTNFRGVVSLLSPPGTTEFQMKEGFMYMLTKGELPSPSGFWSRVGFGIAFGRQSFVRRNQWPPSWLMSADRLSITRTFQIFFSKQNESISSVQQEDWPQSKLCLKR